MNAKKPLRILLIASSLTIMSCVGLPPKPTLTICVYDHPSAEGICATKEPNKPAGDLHRVPVADLDKATMLSPEEWKKLEDYIQLLEAYGQACASQQK
jgi:hypothetical protein